MRYLIILSLTVGPILLVLTRSIYRLLGPTRSDADAYFHLHVIEEIRLNNHRLPNSPRQVETEGLYAYPYLLHWLLSYIPKRMMQSVDRFFSPTMDFGLFLFTVSLVPLGYLNPGHLPLVVAILVFTPELVRPDQSHAIGLSARKPGLLVVTGTVLALVVYLETGVVLALGVSIVLASFVPLLSKFGLQALTALLFVLGVLVNPVALLVLISSFALAILTSRGRYLTILRTHIRHLNDYAVSKQYKRFDHSFLAPVVLLRELSAADSPKEVAQTIFDSRRTFPFFCNIPVVISLIGLSWAAVSGVDLIVARPVLVWLFAGVAAGAVTSLPHLLFLGEPERYLEYVYLPSFVVTARAWTELGVLFKLTVGTLVASSGIIIFSFVWIFQTHLYEPKRDAALEDLVEHLQALQPATLIIQPSVIARNIIHLTEHSVVETLGNQASTEDIIREYNRLFPEKHSRITDDIDWLRERYDPDWVIYDLRWLDRDLQESLRRPSSDPVYANDQFELYPFDAVAAEQCDSPSKRSLAE